MPAPADPSDPAPALSAEQLAEAVALWRLLEQLRRSGVSAVYLPLTEPYRPRVVGKPIATTREKLYS